MIPAAGYFETVSGFEVLRDFAPSLERGQLALLGNGATPVDFIESKQVHWAGDQSGLEAYTKTADARLRALPGGAWRDKVSSTDAFLIARWDEAVANGTHPLLNVWERSPLSAASLETEVLALPRRLDGAALLRDQMLERMTPRFRGALQPIDKHELRLFLARGFFGSYLESGPTALLADSRLGDVRGAFTLGTPEVNVRRVRQLLQPLQLDSLLLQRLTEQDLAELADSPAWHSMAAELRPRFPAGPSFTAVELKALRRVRRRGGQSGRWPRPTVQAARDLIERELIALDEARQDAASRNGGAIWKKLARDRRLERSMSGQRFNGPVYNFGVIGDTSYGGEVNVTNQPPERILSYALTDVLRARDPNEAALLAAALDRELGSRPGFDQKLVESVLTNDLSDVVEQARPSVRTRLMDLGTGAGAGVISSGIVEGLRAVIGG